VVAALAIGPWALAVALIVIAGFVLNATPYRTGESVCTGAALMAGIGAPVSAGIGALVSR
jgi:hypothetical protein